MIPNKLYSLVIVDEDGIVLYDPDSLRQTRDVQYLIHSAAQNSCVEQLISTEEAMKLLREAYPNRPRLPVGRPAVICGNDLTRLWYRFCRDADAELLKSVAIARCNSAVTDS